MFELFYTFASYIILCVLIVVMKPSVRKCNVSRHENERNDIKCIVCLNNSYTHTRVCMVQYENVQYLADWILKYSSFSYYLIIKAEWFVMFKMLHTHKPLLSS